jgi:hypothetical protein
MTQLATGHKNMPVKYIIDCGPRTKKRDLHTTGGNLAGHISKE